MHPSPHPAWNALLVVAALCLLAGCHQPHDPQSAARPDQHVHDHAHDHAADEDHPGEDAFCAEHGVPEAECGICNPEGIGHLEAGQALQVRLPDRQSARQAGVITEKPTRGGIAEGITCYAELAFDQNKLAQIVAPVDGIVEQVLADLGRHVEEHQTLVRLWSASIAEAVARAVLTHQTLDREQRLRADRVTSEKDLQEAEAAHRAACQQLRTLGFTEEQIDLLSHKPDESVLLDVRAPFAGELIERQAVRGDLVETGRRLFTLVDRSVMWAMLNIPEAALGRIQPGQRVELRVDSIPDRTFVGTLTWISAEVDDRTRMALGRAEISNPDGILRARMFARARIVTRQDENALLVPRAAIQRVEGQPIVFVRRDEDLYEARRVELGTSYDGLTEIRRGLTAEEVVAVGQVFPLKSQLLISRLGAACADE